jgi:predicted transcriptional regulator
MYLHIDRSIQEYYIDNNSAIREVSLMITEGIMVDITQQVARSLDAEPGMTVKGLASALNLNRQFMAGFLSALEERGEVFHRKVGPARIYFLKRNEKAK